MIQIDLIIEGGKWPGEAELQKLTATALQATIPHLFEPLPESAEVSLLFADNKKVQQLNRQWRIQDKPTNVLSFAANEGSAPITPILGDIILAYETIEDEAAQQGKTFNHHLTHLVIHGFLHLLGFDHVNVSEAEKMEQLEVNILADLGIGDPY